jgi:hypothetical protein
MMPDLLLRTEAVRADRVRFRDTTDTTILTRVVTYAARVEWFTVMSQVRLTDL